MIKFIRKNKLIIFKGFDYLSIVIFCKKITFIRLTITIIIVFRLKLKVFLP